MTLPLSNFLKTSIYLLLITGYLHTKFYVIWIKETEVMEGEGGGIRPPQVENVLNRPGEIGLNNKNCLEVLRQFPLMWMQFYIVKVIKILIPHPV